MVPGRVCGEKSIYFVGLGTVCSIYRIMRRREGGRW